MIFPSSFIVIIALNASSKYQVFEDIQAFDNGTSLASSLYAHRDLKEATSRAIAKETPFGAFSSVMWVIEPNKLPTLKRLK